MGRRGPTPRPTTGAAPRDHLEQRRLAAAVGPEDRDEGAGIDLERNVLERGAAVVADRDVRERDRGARAGRGGGRRRSGEPALDATAVTTGRAPGRSVGGPRTPGTARTARGDARLTVNPVRSAMRATTSAIPESSASADRPHDEHTTWWWCRASQATYAWPPSGRSSRSTRLRSAKRSSARNTVALPTGSRRLAAASTRSFAVKWPRCSATRRATARRGSVTRTPARSSASMSGGVGVWPLAGWFVTAATIAEIDV